MKITVSKSVLSDVVKVLSQALTRKPAIPILGDFLCKVEGEHLSITASDGDITMQRTIQLDEKAKADGAFCVDAQLLKDSLAGIIEQPVTLDVNETANSFKLVHQSGETHFPICNQNPNEYPAQQPQPYDQVIIIDSTKVIEAINRCIWNAAQDDLRPAMCGICFNIDKGFLDIVASDGCSIVKSSISLQQASAKNIKRSFILPKKAALILSKEPKGIDFTIEFNDKEVKIDTGHEIIFSRLVDAKYPKYNSVFPADHSVSTQIDKLALSNLVRKALPFTLNAGGTAVISLRFDGTNRLDVVGENSDFFTGCSDYMFVDDYEGNALTIGLDGNRLLAMLKQVGSVEMLVEMTDPDRPVIIKPAKPADEDVSVVMLIMPVLTNE